MKNPPECNTKMGAYELAAKLRAFWAHRGKYPSIWVEQDNRNTSDVMWHVRSNMVGGRPVGALKIPQRLTYSRVNHHLCAKIGVRIDNRDLQNTCLSYDVAGGSCLVQTPEGPQIRRGKIEPYWR